MVERAGAPITTILFTDLVDSTALMQRVGDERAQNLFHTHHQLFAVTIFLKRAIINMGASDRYGKARKIGMTRLEWAR